MSTEAAAILAIIVTGLIGGVWYWNERVRRASLEELGLKPVDRVLHWELDSRRRVILVRGWITSHEWTELNRRQIDAINSELTRRGDADERESQQ